MAKANIMDYSQMQSQLAFNRQLINAAHISVKDFKAVARHYKKQNHDCANKLLAAMVETYYSRATVLTKRIAKLVKLQKALKEDMRELCASNYLYESIMEEYS